MSIFNEFPYTNFHELNLDWLIKQVKETDEKVDNFILDTDEKIIAEVNTWLEEHPEATTTVLDNSLTTAKYKDGSVTVPKLETNLQINAEMFIHNRDELESAINDPRYSTYYLANFHVAQPINIEDSRTATNITFIGGEITLDSVLFTNPSLANSTSWAIPNFVGTSFVAGDYNVIFDAGFYVLWGSFVGCRFDNVSFVNGSKCVQSTRFTNCYMIAEAGTPNFMNTNAAYDIKFTGCDWEQTYNAILLNVVKDQTWGNNVASNTSQIVFVNCTSEGRTKPLVRQGWGDVCFIGCYFEDNTAPVVVIYEETATHRHYTAFYNCLLHAATPSTLIVAMVTNAANANIMSGTSFVAIGCQIANCTLCNTNTFYKYIVEGCKILTNATVYPANTLSRVDYQDGSNGWSNGLVHFKNGTNQIITDANRLTLVTFQCSEPGTHIVLIGKASGAYSNTPFAKCLDNPDLTFTATYNSSDETITTTLPSGLGTLQTRYNLSAIDLQGLQINNTKGDYYAGAALSGFTPAQFKAINVAYSE